MMNDLKNIFPKSQQMSVLGAQGADQLQAAKLRGKTQARTHKRPAGLGEYRPCRAKDGSVLSPEACECSKASGRVDAIKAAHIERFKSGFF